MYPNSAYFVPKSSCIGTISKAEVSINDSKEPDAVTLALEPHYIWVHYQEPQ